MSIQENENGEIYEVRYALMDEDTGGLFSHMTGDVRTYESIEDAKSFRELIYKKWRGLGIPEDEVNIVKIHQTNKVVEFIKG